MILIKCEKCGESIEFKGGNHKYCETCSIKIEKEKARLRIKGYRQQHTHLCVNCGKTIYNYKGYNHKYCKSCTENIKLETIRVAMINYRRKWKDVLKSAEIK